MSILTAIWALINSPIGVGLVAAALAAGLAALYKRHPNWRRFEGTIIAAVKAAEKAIPDDTPSVGARRLNAALQYTIRVVAETTGRVPTAAETANLIEGIQIIHADLEATGGMLGARPAAEGTPAPPTPND